MLTSLNESISICMEIKHYLCNWNWNKTNAMNGLRIEIN